MARKMLVLDDDSMVPPLKEETTGSDLEEKIKQLALANLDWNAGQIAGELGTPEQGDIRVGKLTVWKILRKLNLSSKKDRERFLKSK